MTKAKTPAPQMSAPERSVPAPTVRRERPNTARAESARAAPSTRRDATEHDAYVAPGAGAHAADHLINHEATPGSGALPSHAHRSGKEVDGGAG